MPGVPGAKQYTPARPDGMKGPPPQPGEGMRPPAIPAGEGGAPPVAAGNPRLDKLRAGAAQLAARNPKLAAFGQKIQDRFAPQAGRPAPIPPAAAPGGPRTPPQMPPRDMQANYDAAKQQAGAMKPGMGFKKGGMVSDRTKYAK